MDTTSNNIPEFDLNCEALDQTLDASESLPQSVVLQTKKRKFSTVWSHFEQVEKKTVDGSVVTKAVCKICTEELVCGGRSGTSHLNRHMASCLKKTAIDAQQTVIGRCPNGSVYSFTFSQAKARWETVRYFVREELAFNKVEKPAFHRWVKNSFGPQFKPFCRNTLRADVMQMFGEEKLKLKALFQTVPGKICFTSDMWSSKQKLGYLCLTAHYVTSDWKLNKRVISFPILPSPHTGLAIGESIHSNILGWNICSKIGTLTLDNASNNDVAITCLKTFLFDEDSLSKEMFHIRCNAHVTNLMVDVGLSHMKLCLVNIRESVKHVKHSSSRLQKFFECCRSLNLKERRLPIDIKTRWDSTYLMLCAAIPYQKAFELFFIGVVDYQYIPTNVDWKNAVVIRDFFKIFCETTKMFSGRKYVTSTLFCYQLSKIACFLKKYSVEPSFALMYNSMKAKYDKYWKNIPIVLGLASCMDPRYKMTILELCIELNYETETAIEIQSAPVLSSTFCERKLQFYKQKLVELFEEYKKNNISITANQGASTSTMNDEEDMVSALLARRRETSSQTCKSDLQRYLDQPLLITNEPNFNVLEWWQSQEGMYPVLAAMARDLMTIPVSTVASESAFSGSERVFSKYRSSLIPETVEALVCLKDWFQVEEGFEDEDTDDLADLMRDTEL